MYKRLSLTMTVLVMMLITFAQCSEDKSPTGPRPKPSQWGGILITDKQANVVGGDASDWCLPATPAKGGLPDEYALYPAYPNPAVDSIVIVYDLPAASLVQLSIVDSIGAVRKRLVDTTQDAGQYQVAWHLDDSNYFRLSPGSYRSTLTAGRFSCSGDIEILPDLRQITVYGFLEADTLAAVYVSPVDVGGLTMKFTTPGTLGFISYGPATTNMARLDTLKNDTLIVALLPDISQPRPMPVGTHILFRVRVSGNPRLVEIDASDSLGYNLPRVIRNMSF
jgi:hypothetical protein